MEWENPQAALSAGNEGSRQQTEAATATPTEATAGAAAEAAARTFREIKLEFLVGPELARAALPVPCAALPLLNARALPA